MKELIAILIASAIPLCAADPVDVSPYQLCREANFHELRLTTTSGDIVEGLCVSVDVNDIAIDVKGKPVKVAREKISRLLVISNQHQLRSLGKGVRGGLHWGFKALLSPAAVVGVVAIPATLAWGAVSTPFCIVGDLVAKSTPDKEIKLK